MTPKKWIDGVNAIGIISKAGKYNGGTYTHKDIALNKTAIRQMKVLAEETPVLSDGSDERQA